MRQSPNSDGAYVPVENGINIHVKGAFYRGGKFPCEAKTVIRRRRPFGTDGEIRIFILHVNEVQMEIVVLLQGMETGRIIPA